MTCSTCKQTGYNKNGCPNKASVSDCIIWVKYKVIFTLSYAYNILLWFARSQRNVGGSSVNPKHVQITGESVTTQHMHSSSDQTPTMEHEQVKICI